MCRQVGQAEPGGNIKGWSRAEPIPDQAKSPGRRWTNRANGNGDAETLSTNRQHLPDLWTALRRAAPGGYEEAMTPST